MLRVLTEYTFYHQKPYGYTKGIALVLLPCTFEGKAKFSIGVTGYNLEIRIGRVGLPCGADSFNSDFIIINVI